MKLSNLTPTPPGHLALALAVVVGTLAGCPSDDEDLSLMSEGTSPSVTTDTPATGSGGDTESETGTTVPTGLGCVEPEQAVACDRGELVGSVRIEDEASAAELAGYTSITGWVEVLNTDFTCLDFLACLETVGRDITIFGNEQLTDISGTNQITALGLSTAEMPAADKDGSLIFSQNPAMIEMDGFASLEQTQESLTISDNEAMTTISGFGSMVGMQRDITLKFNPVLTDINGLQGLSFVGNDCVITNNETLCITEIVASCGDLVQGPFGGSTANNDNDC